MHLLRTNKNVGSASQKRRVVLMLPFAGRYCILVFHNDTRLPGRRYFSVTSVETTCTLSLMTSKGWMARRTTERRRQCRRAPADSSRRIPNSRETLSMYTITITTSEPKMMRKRHNFFLLQKIARVPLPTWGVEGPPVK